MEEYPGQTAGSKRYHYDGFDYRRDNLKLVRTVEFRCITRNCHGRAMYSVEDPTNIKVKAIHNHPRNKVDFAVWKFRKELKERASKDLASPLAQIFKDVSREHPEAAVLVAPHRERRRMRLARRKLFPKSPDTYEELGDLLENDESIRKLYGMSDPLPGEEEKERFFQSALRNPHGTTLVFASPHMLDKCLKTSSKVKIDATFKVLPGKPKGRQLLTLHATHGVNAFPVVFAVMESKRKASYIQLLEYIKLLCPLWQPEEVMADFEKSLRMAVGVVYPNCRILGCYFHFCQAIQKNWSQHGLMKMQQKFQEESKELKKSIMALPFAKADDIPKIFVALDDNLSLAFKREQKVQSFLAYFERTWLSKNDKHFKPEDYSVYGYPDRTNNHVESFHSRLQEVRPNIWVFLNLLISLCVEARQNFTRFVNGLEITQRIPNKILWNDERVVHANELYNAGRISGVQYVKWCRSATSRTLAIVRQGRRLKRFIRAERMAMEYDDVPTSSDSSNASHSSFDSFDYEPNPHRVDVMEAEDRELDRSWEQDLRDEDELPRDDNDADAMSLPESNDRIRVDRDENEQPQDDNDAMSLPDSNNSIWDLEEDEDLMLVRASQMDDDQTPVIRVPDNLEPTVRAPMSCIVCLSEVATVIALPCRHALLCLGCKFQFEGNCYRCNVLVLELVDLILT